MLGSELYQAIDESIESWCILRLNVETQDDHLSVTGWEVGFGNSANLIDTESRSVSDSYTEAELLRYLMEDVLEERRRTAVDVTVITPKISTLPMLRTRLLYNDIEATFRGLYHVSLERILAEHFATCDEMAAQSMFKEVVAETGQQVAGEPSVTHLWQILTRIGPLVPRDALVGEPL